MSWDCTSEAITLFSGFAERHGLRYEPDHDAPVEVLWKFPIQPKLFHPIALGLQNGDELNFGVADFWSFFPYEKSVATFEELLDAWIAGLARIAITGFLGRVMQIERQGSWNTIYRANTLLPMWRKPRRFIQNIPFETS